MGCVSLLKNPLSHLLPRPRVGQQVKLTASDGLNTERVWVEVRLASLNVSGQPLFYAGRVKSMSYAVDGWEYNDRICFGPEHIQDVMGWGAF